MKKYELLIVIKEVEGQETSDVFREFSVRKSLSAVGLRLIQVMNHIIEQIAQAEFPAITDPWSNTLPDDQTPLQTMRRRRTFTNGGRQ